MIKLLLEMKIENVFKAKDYTDKTSGEVKVGKWKVQGFDKVETDDGTQLKLIDVSVPDEVALKLKEQVGKTVTINVGAYSNNGRVGYYGL